MFRIFGRQQFVRILDNFGYLDNFDNLDNFELFRKF